MIYQFVSYWIQDEIGKSFFTICGSNILEEPRKTVGRFFPGLDVSHQNKNFGLTRFYVASEPMNQEEIYEGENTIL